MISYFVWINDSYPVIEVHGIDWSEESYRNTIEENVLILWKNKQCLIYEKWWEKNNWFVRLKSVDIVHPKRKVSYSVATKFDKRNMSSGSNSSSEDSPTTSPVSSSSGNEDGEAEIFAANRNNTTVVRPISNCMWIDRTEKNVEILEFDLSNFSGRYQRVDEKMPNQKSVSMLYAKFENCNQQPIYWFHVPHFYELFTNYCVKIWKMVELQDGPLKHCVNRPKCLRYNYLKMHYTVHCMPAALQWCHEIFIWFMF